MSLIASDTKRLETAFNNLKLHVRCPICLNILSNPVRLNCRHHSLCLLCFNAVIKRSEGDIRNQRRCPQCFLPISKRGSLFDNPYLVNFVQQIQFLERKLFIQDEVETGEHVNSSSTDFNETQISANEENQEHEQADFDEIESHIESTINEVVKGGGDWSADQHLALTRNWKDFRKFSAVIKAQERSANIDSWSEISQQSFSQAGVTFKDSTDDGDTESVTLVIIDEVEDESNNSKDDGVENEKANHCSSTDEGPQLADSFVEQSTYLPPSIETEPGNRPIQGCATEYAKEFESRHSLHQPMHKIDLPNIDVICSVREYESPTVDSSQKRDAELRDMQMAMGEIMENMRRKLPSVSPVKLLTAALPTLCDTFSKQDMDELIETWKAKNEKSKSAIKEPVVPILGGQSENELVTGADRKITQIREKTGAGENASMIGEQEEGKAEKLNSSQERPRLGRGHWKPLKRSSSSQQFLDPKEEIAKTDGLETKKQRRSAEPAVEFMEISASNDCEKLATTETELQKKCDGKGLFQDYQFYLAKKSFPTRGDGAQSDYEKLKGWIDMEGGNLVEKAENLATDSERGSRLIVFGPYETVSKDSQMFRRVLHLANLFQKKHSDLHIKIVWAEFLQHSKEQGRLLDLQDYQVHV